jgi:hypothetical protein
MTSPSASTQDTSSNRLWIIGAVLGGVAVGVLVIKTHIYNMIVYDIIDYYIAFFISYHLSALGHDTSPRTDRLKG